MIGLGATVSVRVVNPAPAGGTSLSKTVIVTNPLPTLTKLSPASAKAGGAAFALTATGAGFNANSKIWWNGAAVTTKLVNATTLTAQISAAQIAAKATLPVLVANPAPGGGKSSAISFKIN